MTVVKSAFEAQYGFKSPGFSVDDQGNVTLKSITYTVTEEEIDLAGDFLVRQAGNAFTVDGYYQAGSDVELQPNPALEVTRGSTYVFNLKLRELNQAGQLLGALGGQQQAMRVQDLNTLMGIGGVQRQIGQAGLEAARQSQLQAQYEPYQRIEFLKGIMTNLPTTQSTITASTAPGTNPLAQALGTGLGAYSAYQMTRPAGA